MRFRQTFMVSIIAAASGTLAAWLFVTPSSNEKHETTYERVMRTGTLRCGYWNWAPLLSFVKGPEDLKGIFKDYTEELGRVLNLKIEWTTEVGFGALVQDIKTNKVDAVCGGVWPAAATAREMDFTMPIFYVPMLVIVKDGNHQFDRNLAALNNPSITFSGMDGLLGVQVVHSDFPHAKLTQLPDTAPVADVFNMVATGKADVTLNDLFTVEDYIAHNPGTIRIVPTDKPIRYFGNTIGIGKGEYELKRMLDTATEQLIYSGAVDRIIDKYERHPGSLLRVARPYETTK